MSLVYYNYGRGVGYRLNRRKTHFISCMTIYRDNASIFGKWIYFRIWFDWNEDDQLTCSWFPTPNATDGWSVWVEKVAIYILFLAVLSLVNRIDNQYNPCSVDSTDGHADHDVWNVEERLLIPDGFKLKIYWTLIIDSAL